MCALRLATAACFLSVIVLAITGQNKIAQTKMGGIRKVAVLSVTGPSRLDAAGQHSSLSLQDAINHAEATLVQTLSTKGLRVVSLADSKIFADANWEAAYANSLRDSRSLPRAGLESASRNTLVLRDLPSTNSATYSKAFRRAAGELARQMGADGAVLLNMNPGLDLHGLSTIQQVVQMMVIDQAGETIFRDEVRCESEVLRESQAAKNFDTRQLCAAINKATDEGIRIALEHYSGK